MSIFLILYLAWGQYVELRSVAYQLRWPTLYAGGRKGVRKMNENNSTCLIFFAYFRRRNLTQKVRLFTQHYAT